MARGSNWIGLRVIFKFEGRSNRRWVAASVNWYLRYSWVFGQADNLNEPMWDSGVRQALKRAADAEGCDFPGFGHHSLHSANITWRQEVGGSSPESALGVGPRLPQHEPGDLDTRDSGGENEPTLWPRQSWSFSRRRSRSFRDRDITGAIVSRAGLEPNLGIDRT